MQAGATGYLLQDMPASDLAQAIWFANAGIYPETRSGTAAIWAVTVWRLACVWPR